MRGASPSLWFQKSNKNSHNNTAVPVDPHTAQLPPRHTPSKLTFSSLQLPSHRAPSKVPSGTSLRSAYSSSAASHKDPAAFAPHPFAAMVSAPLPVVSNHDSDDEEECPVCLEPLSFSFRLPGEKPHIVPECGHALHEACFTAVYGPPPGAGRGPQMRKSNLGVCGVCRRPMKVGDGDGGKSNKLAALTGMGSSSAPALYPGRDSSSARASNVSGPHSHPSSPSTPYSPQDDDPLEPAPPSSPSQYVVAPSITVRAEFPTIARNIGELTQALTCIVVVELPGKRAASGAPVPGPAIMSDPYSPPPSGSLRSPSMRGSQREATSPEPYFRAQHANGYAHHHQTMQSDVSEATVRRGGARSPGMAHDSYAPSERELASPAPSTQSQSQSQSHEDDPFRSITEDLRNRIIDWKGHPLSGLGPLQMFDLLSVRRDSLVREFFVYLFREAIICVAEERKRTLGRFLVDKANDGSGDGTGRGVLRLKGRIYIKHIRQVTDTSVQGELSLTIDMEDERLDSFILIFRDRASLETWRNNVQSLVGLQRREPSAQLEGPLDMEEFGGSMKAARMLSGGTVRTGSTGNSTNTGGAESLLASERGSTMSSVTSHGSVPAAQYRQQHKLAPLEEDTASLSQYAPSLNVAYTPHMSAGPSNALAPLPHPPMDLILVLAIPSPNAVAATAALKTRVVKAALDFLCASLSSRDRISIVTFEVGVGGRVRKTPFLRLGKTQSRARIGRFVDEIGYQGESGRELDDEFLVRGAKEEKTDVVTAVNHGLDVVLQRKARNPVAGMLLVSDAADSTRRAQMDLVLARAEAANVPIHSFGYGRAHDPASLWLMSNHTGGTYTFVKDWYDLRDSLAGCVGGMMSIGALAMKLHMKIVDGNRFRIRKVSGGPQAVVASDGRNVDLELGELRYGERKEMLVELELDNSDVPMHAHHSPAHAHSQHNRAMNATDRFHQSMGLDALSIDDMADLTDGMMDRMIDEVPVFEVDGAFFDPAASKHVSRLAHPVLLTVTLLPPSAGPSPNQGSSDPVIVRRRMELLASDMITRALVLVSRKNYVQAQKIMGETKRILHTVLQTITQSLPPPSNHGSTVRNRREVLTLAAVRVMQAILQDMQILSEALEENVDLFAHDQRNFGAQQAMILRDQKSWTGRSATERVFWTTDNSIELVSRSTDWVARE